MSRCVTLARPKPVSYGVLLRMEVRDAKLLPISTQVGSLSWVILTFKTMKYHQWVSLSAGLLWSKWGLSAEHKRPIISRIARNVDKYVDNPVDKYVGKTVGNLLKTRWLCGLDVKLLKVPWIYQVRDKEQKPSFSLSSGEARKNVVKGLYMQMSIWNSQSELLVIVLIEREEFLQRKLPLGVITKVFMITTLKGSNHETFENLSRKGTRATLNSSWWTKCLSSQIRGKSGGYLGTI